MEKLAEIVRKQGQQEEKSLIAHHAAVSHKLLTITFENLEDLLVGKSRRGIF